MVTAALVVAGATAAAAAAVVAAVAAVAGKQHNTRSHKHAGRGEFLIRETFQVVGGHSRLNAFRLFRS